MKEITAQKTIAAMWSLGIIMRIEVSQCGHSYPRMPDIFFFGASTNLNALEHFTQRILVIKALPLPRKLTQAARAGTERFKLC